MSNGVEFDEDKYGLQAAQLSQRTAGGQAGGSEANSKMVRWLVARGIVKSNTGGRMVLLAVVIINIAITYAVVTYLL